MVIFLWRDMYSPKVWRINISVNGSKHGRNAGDSAEAVLRAKTGWFLWRRQTQTSIMLQTLSPKAKDNLPQQGSIIGYF